MAPNPPKPIPVKVNIPHKDQIPPFMHEFIEKVVDVAGDGHCGFLAVAGLCNLTVDDHRMICYQLQKELTGEENEHYRRLIGANRRYKQVLGALNFSGIGPAPPNKWMIMPNMGFLIAQRYKHVVVLLSIEKRRSKTFFPLCGEPSHRDRLMCLAHVNDNHFMMIYLKDGCPIPPTFVLWRRHHRDDAKKWLDRYVHRMVEYNAICRAAGYEVVGDDEDLYIIENLDSEENVVVEKKVEDDVKIDKDESFNLDDCNIDLGVD